MMRKVFTAMALTALAALPVRADVYSIDKGHSEVTFQVRNLLNNRQCEPRSRQPREVLGRLPHQDR
jgi:hypothetical protein